ncbi:thymidylate synthase [Escherichia coli]|nr:thymidylate synthase [Escherichia coli]
MQFLKDNGVKIWDAWADENGDLGPVYGVAVASMGRYPHREPYSEYRLKEQDRYFP